MIDPKKLKIGDYLFFDDAPYGIKTFGKVISISEREYQIDWDDIDIAGSAYDYDDPSDIAWHKNCIIITEKDKLIIQLKHGEDIQGGL